MSSTVAPRRLRVAVLLALALLASGIGALVAPATPTAALGTSSSAFSGTSCTGWASVTAPANAIRAAFEIAGGGGAGADTNGGSGGNGGRGARVTGWFTVNPGDKIWVKIGCGGTDANNVQAEGYARGGASAAVTGGGGGAATAICRGNNTGCAGGEVMAIAGGGGGGGGGTGSGTVCSNQNGGGGGAAVSGGTAAVASGTVVGSNGGGNGSNNGNAWANGGGGAGTGAGGGGAASYANPGGSGANANGSPPAADRDPGWGAGGFGPNTPSGESSRAGGGGGGGYAGGGGGASAKQACTANPFGTSRVSGAAGGGGGSSWYRSTVSNVSVTNDGGGSGTGGGGGGGGWASAITWTTNAPPTGGNQTTATATHGVGLTINLIASDPDGDNPVTCSIQGGPSNGTLSAGTSCSRTYTASTTAVDSDSFTYRPVDSQGRAGDLFTVTIPIVNRKPVGTAVAAPGQTFDKGTGTTINLGASDPDGHTPLTCTITDAPDKGQISAGTGCSRTFTPNPNTVGADSLTYTVTDSKGLAGDPVTVNLTIANRAPTAANQQVTVTAGAPTSIALGAADLDGDTLSCTVNGLGPAKGDLTGTGCTRTYTSDAGSANGGVGGSDSFTYSVADQPGAESAAGTVAITIANPDLSLAKSHTGRFAEGTGSGTYTLTVATSAAAAAHGTTTLVDTLPEGMRFRSAATGSSGFTCSGTPGVSTDVTCSRTATIPASTSLSLTITVDVVAGAQSPQTNEAVVSSPYELATTADDNTATDATLVNHRPSGTDQTVTGGTGTPVDVTLGGSDEDPEDAEALTFAASDPANGSVTVTGDQAQYTPDAGYAGIDTFTYTVTDGGGLTSVAKTVTVYSGVRTLTGRVTDDSTGAPLAGVEVRLVENADPAASTYLGTVLTGTDGRYDLATLFPAAGAVPVGVYALRYVDPSNDHHPEWWQDAPSRAAGTDTDLGALPLGVERDAALVPAGRITGTVRSSAAPHAPVTGLQVRLSRVGVTASSATTTGTGGEYAFQLLTPGEYQVWFRDLSGEWISEWSDEASSRDQAGTITVGVGTQVPLDELIDPVAPPPPPDSGSITGTVRSSATGQAPLSGVQVRLYKAPYTASAATTTDANGQYSFTRLAPGDYKLWFRDTTGAWVSNYGSSAATTLDEAAALSVANDGHIRDALLAPKTTTPPPPPTSGVVSGTVTEIDGFTPIAGLQVRISAVGSTGSRSTTTLADGSYSFAKLAPGQYVVWFRDTGRTWYSEYHLNAATAAAATPVTAADGQTTDVDASLTRK